ncbi:diiron oxygenase [Nocardioides sp.]|uniref:AurF N-oxygenase family protein n=1 Tax=Nocardioides sp. TaxID=35761 RepID=UPI00286C157D|nr:diiron oxygenase [Nocardioides sp.]
MTITSSPTSSSGRTAQPIDRATLSRRLLTTAKKHSFDPFVELDLDAEIDPDVFWASPQLTSLYGTPLWDEMTHRQRVELSKHELASMYHVELWVETALMQMLVRYVYDLPGDSPEAWHVWTEIAEECRHSTMFGRVIAAAGCPDYSPGWLPHLLARAFKTMSSPTMTMAGALFFEEYGDTLQRVTAKDDTIQPLVRQASLIHVVEEARHIQFARDELSRRVPELNVGEKAALRAVLGPFAVVVVDNMVHPDVYANVGLPAERAKAEARKNRHHHETIRWASQRSVELFESHGLVGPLTRALWKRSHVL